MNLKSISFVFFGSDQFSIGVLIELEKAGFMPTLIVTTPPHPKGRGLKLTSTPVHDWALAKQIPTLTPEKLDSTFSDQLPTNKYQLFLVASYGKIIPRSTLDIPEKGCLNVHPSLLPAYRGATPIETAILDGISKTGVTIIKMDDKVDHGAIICSTPVVIDIEKESKQDIEIKLAKEGGKLLSNIIPKWINDEIQATPQDDGLATSTKLLKKENGLIDLNADPILNLRKIRAYEGWPGSYFFTEQGGRKVRIKIITAHISENKLIIDRVIPEGQRERDYKKYVE